MKLVGAATSAVSNASRIGNHLPIAPAYPRAPRNIEGSAIRKTRIVRRKQVAAERSKERKDLFAKKMTVKDRISLREYNRLSVVTGKEWIDASKLGSLTLGKELKTKLKKLDNSAIVNGEWKVVSACLFERLPIIERNFAQWEKDFFDLQDKRAPWRYRVFPDGVWDPPKRISETVAVVDKESIAAGEKYFEDPKFHFMMKQAALSKKLVESVTGLKVSEIGIKGSSTGKKEGKKSGGDASGSSSTKESKKAGKSKSSDANDAASSSSGAAATSQGSEDKSTVETGSVKKAKDVKATTSNANSIESDLVVDEDDNSQQAATAGKEGQKSTRNTNNRPQYWPRTTEADKKDDRKSLARKLSERLYLIVKFGNSNSWGFLYDIRNQDKPEELKLKKFVPSEKDPSIRNKIIIQESMADAAHRRIRELFDIETLDATFVGKVPAGYHVMMKEDLTKKILPKAPAASNLLGTKVFFYRAQIKTGNLIDLNSKKAKDLDVVDYAWVTRDELKEYNLEWTSSKDANNSSNNKNNFSTTDYFQDLFMDD